MYIEFKKEDNGKWYAVLPDWPHDHDVAHFVFDGEHPEMLYINVRN